LKLLKVDFESDVEYDVDFVEEVDVEISGFVLVALNVTW